MIMWKVLETESPLVFQPGQRRKGARSTSSIPSSILSALNDGIEETVTLSEWLAISLSDLLGCFRRDCGFSQAAVVQLAKKAAERQGIPFTKRLKASGSDIFDLLMMSKDSYHAIISLALHRSDMIRALLCYAHGFDTSLSLAERLIVSRFFAADRSMSVRECAWDAMRPHLASDLLLGIALLGPWVRDPDENIRRCAIEGTRPRGVWCSHISLLKDNPALGLDLLEHVKSDPSRYVLTAASNWLNDASKSQPEWVREICERWLHESPTPETQWLCKRALRSLQ